MRKEGGMSETKKMMKNTDLLIRVELCLRLSLGTFALKREFSTVCERVSISDEIDILHIDCSDRNAFKILGSDRFE